MASTPTLNVVETTPKLPVNLTSTAIVKVKEIMGQQNPVPRASLTPCHLKTPLA
jgi:hypothetical protein